MRWLVLENPAFALRSNLGDNAALTFARALYTWSASGCVHSSREPAPNESNVPCANAGSFTGPISFWRSPLTKKRTWSEPPDAFMPPALWFPRTFGVVRGLVRTLNDVRLSSVHVP